MNITGDIYSASVTQDKEKSMKNTNGLRFIVGLGSDDHEYSINGVRYVVSSRFQNSFGKPKNPMMSERINGYLSGDFANLTVPSSSDTMAGEYVCSDCKTSDDVIEEDLCSRKKQKRI